MAVSKGRTIATPGAVGGFAPLDSGLLVPQAYLPHEIHLGDRPPASPDSRNEEWDSATPVNTWTDVTNSGTPTNAAFGDERFDNLTTVANPRWNANTDIPGALIMQPKAGAFYKRYMSFAPASGTKWAVAAKVSLNTADKGTADLAALQLYKETPGASGWNPTDGMALRLSTVGAGSVYLYSESWNGGSSGGAVGADGFGTVLYLAMTGLTTNHIYTWASSDGIGWQFLGSYTGLNINANINYLALTVFDVVNLGAPVMGVFHWLRFLQGSNNLHALVAGN